ncbi:tetratricopeptide repeat protein [Catellatospora paridis]|uniref:tetratricopeptide repeat protein n=1 Tax=Catellatospora paridis TaxID=1617086 RepID=UPI0012D411FD|nr:tetratricopeptide repeat protein [Catellatospora paridis]
MTNLGLLAYEAGDVDAARGWYQRAADLGHAVGMHNLGVLARAAGDVDTARGRDDGAD